MLALILTALSFYALGYAHSCYRDIKRISIENEFYERLEQELNFKRTIIAPIISQMEKEQRGILEQLIESSKRHQIHIEQFKAPKGLFDE